MFAGAAFFVVVGPVVDMPPRISHDRDLVHPSVYRVPTVLILQSQSAGRSPGG